MLQLCACDGRIVGIGGKDSSDVLDYNRAGRSGRRQGEDESKVIVIRAAAHETQSIQGPVGAVVRARSGVRNDMVQCWLQSESNVDTEAND